MGQRSKLLFTTDTMAVQIIEGGVRHQGVESVVSVEFLKNDHDMYEPTGIVRHGEFYDEHSGVKYGGRAVIFSERLVMCYESSKVNIKVCEALKAAFPDYPLSKEVILEIGRRTFKDAYLRAFNDVIASKFGADADTIAKTVLERFSHVRDSIESVKPYEQEVTLNMDFKMGFSDDSRERPAEYETILLDLPVDSVVVDFKSRKKR